MLRPYVSSGEPAEVALNPYSPMPPYVYVPKRCWYLRYDQSIVIESTGSAPVQCERWSSHTDCAALGATPRSGSARCHAWSAQYEPSGALQAATFHASAGPS